MATMIPSFGLANRGFTLVELLVTISMAAVLLTIAVPSFSTLILNQQVRVSAADLQTSLFYARSEAIKRAANVSVVPTGGDWKSGWTVQANDGTVLRAESALNDRLASMVGTTVTYQSDGHIPPPVIGTIVFSVADNSAVTARCIAIDLSGRPSLLVDTDGDASNGCN
jgi:type IV fimbrial biogenesis protein FimT